jgi:ribonuclease HIII
LQLEWVVPSGRPNRAQRLQASHRGCNAERRSSVGLLGDRTHSESNGCPVARPVDSPTGPALRSFFSTNSVVRSPAMTTSGGWIGIDESGKGDYFGPLVIAAVHVTPRIAEDLMALNVRDSKKIADSVIRTLEVDIKTLCRHSVIAIGPERYNEMYAKIRNLNRLLAWGHAKALETLLEQVPDCGRAIADQFGDERLIQNALQEKGRKIILEQRHKGEEDIAVAAASIVARAEFVRRLERLAAQWGVPLPKGASPAVEVAAKSLVRKHGEEGLAKVAKLHFKTTKAVLGET